jgi:hypothetical protein
MAVGKGVSCFPGFLRGRPFKALDSATRRLRRLRRGGFCQLGPAPRRVLRSIQFAKCKRQVPSLVQRKRDPVGERAGIQGDFAHPGKWD